MKPSRIFTLLRRTALPLALMSGVGALALSALPADAALAARASAGTAWREVDQISIRAADVEMVGVAALGPDNAWALAEVDYANGNVKPLLQHWNGQRWRQFTIPARIVNSFSDTTLWDAFGVAPDGTLWAFGLDGTYLSRSAGHWHAGVLPGHGTIEAVTVFSRTDVWAFGSKVSGTDLTLKFAPYAAHFDGQTWRTVKVPGASDISAVTAVSPSDMYAVTGLLAVLGKPAAPRVLHWNGSTWGLLPVQPDLTRQTVIYSILAQHSRVYLAGSVPAGKKTSAALVERFDGRSWSNVTPAAGRSSEITLSLARAPDGGIWAITVNDNSAAEQIWHRAHGTWSAPVRVPWFLGELSAIPDSASTWGCGTVKIRGQYRGVIVLNGPIPAREG